MLRGFRAVCAGIVRCLGRRTARGLFASKSRSPRAARRESAMVTDTGGLGDRSFNDSALPRAWSPRKKQLHADIAVLQSRSASDYQPNLTVLANKEYDLIFAIGFLMAKDVDEVAAAFRSATSPSSTPSSTSPTSRRSRSKRRTARFSPARRRRWRARPTRSRFWAESTSRCCANSRPGSPRARARSTRPSRSR